MVDLILMIFLIIAAIVPVFLLCFYIYKMDMNHEPLNLLLKIFFFGFFSTIPVFFVEKFFDKFFVTGNINSFIGLFLYIFLSIAIVEEGFKWIVVKIFGYNNKEFDEFYDIIVYSVFSSLGFGCAENIVYVCLYGFGNALLRGFLSIPGHTCFGIIMGFFLSRAKMGQINKNKIKYYRNIILSFLIPSFIHTIYDTLLLYSSSSHEKMFLVLFFIFHINTIVICFQIIDKISNVQQTISMSLNTGVLVRDENGELSYHPIKSSESFCPVCGNNVKKDKYCSSCGFRVNN